MNSIILIKYISGSTFQLCQRRNMEVITNFFFTKNFEVRSNLSYLKQATMCVCVCTAFIYECCKCFILYILLLCNPHKNYNHNQTKLRSTYAFWYCNQVAEYSSAFK